MSDDRGSPEKAFDALRAEVAATRSELSRLAEGVVKPAPDYTPTLGAMAKRLDAIDSNLRHIDLMMPFEVAELPGERYLPHELEKLAEAANDAALKLRQATEYSITQQAFRWWLAAAFGFGAVIGIVLFIGIAYMMPSSAGAWMASAIFSGDPWSAGQTLMRQADPISFERMVELYQACPQDDSVDLCRAAMAGKAVTAAGQ